MAVEFRSSPINRIFTIQQVWLTVNINKMLKN